ncbi:MAG: hypothetical protein M1833_000394 [Piccolia ochrophora]|nr:MAG: hypothetical protein M1833_000394 [Piccolia ochrophora]
MPPKPAWSPRLNVAFERFNLLHARRSPSPHQARSIVARAISASTAPLSNLIRRQQQPPRIPPEDIPKSYSEQTSGPAPGTVVGIVFGSVAGFLFLLWLIYLCFNSGARGSIVGEEDVIVREHRGSRTSRRTETVEVSRSRSRSRSPPPRRSPARTETRTERIIVEERRAPPAPVEREDDIVEVIEDHDRPRRSRSDRRPISGYRAVDPDQFAGGNRPVEEVYTSKRGSRRSRR